MANTARAESAPLAQELQYYDISHRKYNCVKRALDIVISTIALLILWIPMLMLMLCVYIDSPGKIIFRQSRIGKDGAPFCIYKIRTMLASTPGNLSAAEFRDADRYVTRIGTFLRRTSLDELPQFWNVLKGDMSIVGPRPLIVEESSIHKMRLQYGVYQTRPGITGLAQINGRNNISTRKKVALEVLYLKNYGFLTDLKILLCTIPKTVCGTDVFAKFDR